MKKTHMLLVAFLLPCLVTACKRDVPQNHITDLPATADDVGMMMDAGAADVAYGDVIETMDAAGYTYIQIDTGTEKLWAAAPVCKVEVGDKLGVSKAMPMPNWESKTLERQFDLVYFVGSFVGPNGAPLGGGGHGMPGQPAAGQPTASHSVGPTDANVGKVEKAEGGKTVAEIYAEKADLAGKEIKLRGKVVKFSAAILKTNWLHVQDGSGDATIGDHDLTVTSNATVKVGDTVLVTGKLQLDKDFGAGYRYSIIVEDAEVVVE